MPYLLRSIFIALLLMPFTQLHCLGQNKKTNPQYDSTLAKKLGADAYGMKMYVFVLLVTGKNASTDKIWKDSCFAGHMKNMDRLVKAGKLIVAGPFGKNDKNYRGLFILNAKNPEEASEILKTDPAIRDQWLEAQMTPWYGSAGLPEYLKVTDYIWKDGF